MPILYVHGVATRDSAGFDAMEPYLRRLIAPEIAADPNAVVIDQVFWGDSAAKFAWGGASRPKTSLLRQGAKGLADQSADPSYEALLAVIAAEKENQFPEPEPADLSPGSGLTSGRMQGKRQKPIRLSSLTDDELSDVLSAVIVKVERDPSRATELSITVDELAQSSAFRAALANQASPDAEVDFAFHRLDEVCKSTSQLKAMGAGWLSTARDELSEALARAAGLPTYALSVVASETRPWINDRVTQFLGDVFVYLDKRGTARRPGDIMQRLLDKLEQMHTTTQVGTREPLVVLTHSMGGQLVYDAVSHFLPKNPRRSHLRIDFWCATASQVGLFEELKLFRLCDKTIGTGAKVMFPRANLGVWWNVWDPNDFISFTAREIFAGVDDESYSSGLSLLGAHSGYLRRPSFFRRLATKVRDAGKAGWKTP